MTPHTTEALRQQQTLRAIKHYGAALLAGAAFLGSSEANADTMPQALDSGGTTYISPSGNQQYDCTSHFNFRIGIQDDNQFVWQHNIKRNEAFQLASKTFGASILRMNVIYGMVQAYGMKQYIDTVKAATKHHYQVQVTLVPTTAYEPSLSQKLSYKDPDPKIMKKFAYRVASTLGPAVGRYSIGNEPNNSIFLASQSMRSYDAEFRAGRAGVLAANSHAKLTAGELAGGNNLVSWFNNVKQLPSKEITVHPYGDSLLNMLTYAQKARRIGKTLLLSEYGNAVGPYQLQRDRRAIRIAGCSGAGELVFYQLIRDKKASWDTGVVNPPNKSRTK